MDVINDFSNNDIFEILDNPNILIGGNEKVASRTTKEIKIPGWAISTYEETLGISVFFDELTGVFKSNKELMDVEDGKTSDKYLEELRDCVRAYTWLPQLVENTKPSATSEEYKIFQCYEAIYKEKGLWLQSYLLNDVTALTELKFSRAYAQKKAAKTTESLFKLTQTLFSQALLENCIYCQWLLSFSSPAHIWFCVEAESVKEHLLGTRQMSKKNRGRDEVYKSVRQIKQLEEECSIFSLVGRCPGFNFNKVKNLSPLRKAIFCTAIQAGLSEVRIRALFDNLIRDLTGQMSYAHRKKMKGFGLKANGDFFMQSHGKQINSSRKKGFA